MDRYIAIGERREYHPREELIETSDIDSGVRYLIADESHVTRFPKVE